MEVCQVITLSNRAKKFSLLLQMKYRTRFPTCSLHGQRPSGSPDTTLSLKHPQKIHLHHAECHLAFARMTCSSKHWLKKHRSWRGEKEEKERNAVFLHRKRKINSQPVKRPQIFKIKMNAVFSTQIYIRKISSSKQLSSGNIVSLESLRYHSSM